MKSTRRLLSIILCLIMCLSLLPTSAFAAGVLASGEAGADAEFILYTDGKLVISGTGTVEDLEHWSFHGYGSYASADDARKATRTETKTVVIEQGITELGTYVFTECPNLSSVSLPASLTKIGMGAFDDSGLRSIIIPSNVTEIGENAFRDCSKLISVTLSSGLQTIEEYAFDNCTKLTSIVIPANVKKIGNYAFNECGSLRTVTFLGNYSSSLIASKAFVGVTADAYYPVDNNSWNNASSTPFKDYGGRLTWKPLSETSESEGWVNKNGTWNSTTNQWEGGDWYYYVGGKMLISSWKAYGGEWFYFGPDGRMVTGRYQIDGDYYYFGTGGTDDPKLGARYSGLMDGEFYDENGVWQPAYYDVDDSGLDFMTDGWQQIGDKWFYIRNKAKVTGWLYSVGYWYYLDPVTGAMVTGWLSWNGNTYYLRPLDKATADGIPDKEGSMIAGRSANIGGTVYTFDNSGALQGGKLDDNPLNIQTGFRNEGTTAKPDWKFYRSNGTMAKGWELVDSTWYYFDNKGTMQTGWIKVGGVTYYLTKWKLTGSNPDKSNNYSEITDPKTTDAGKMVTGFNKIPYTPSGVNTVRTYFFKDSGALNGHGWIKVGLKWYYLEAEGVVRTGWFRDGSKWYYLLDSSNPVGEMVTGTYKPATLPDGSSNSKDQYFAASGEWMGDSNKWASGKAGAWAEHDGNWYYYNANGDDYPTNANAVTGWQQINGKWYYLDSGATPKGKMLIGWHNIGDRYYFDQSGACLGGWQNIDGVWYYLYPNHDGNFGAMQTGWQYINGNWYYLNEDSSSSSYGALQDGWIQKQANEKDTKLYWFYLEENESSKTYGAQWGGGWKQIGGKWYFFDNQHIGYYGALIQGKWIQTNGKWYYVRPEVPNHPEESFMVTGLVDVPASQSWPDGTSYPSGTYYFDSEGAYQALSGWQQIGGNWYYFDAGTHTTWKSAWVHLASGDYYIGSDGVMVTGWQTIGTDEYYFDPGDGHMWKDADMDGQHLGSDGKKV